MEPCASDVRLFFSSAKRFRVETAGDHHMYDGRGKTPPFGTTDWAAQQFLRMLDQEERQKAELGRLRAAGWRPEVSQQPANEHHGVVFGDGRQAIVDLVQRDINDRRLMQGEARRRAQLQLSQAPQQSGMQIAQGQTTGSPGQAPVLVIPKRPLPMPENLGQGFRKGWHIFSETLRDPAIMPQLTESEVAAFRTTFGLEGGMQYDDIAGGAGNPGRAGVTEGWLADAKARLGSPIEADAQKLMIQQVAQAYKIYADDALRNAGGSEALAQIRDPKTSMQVFDVLLKHGRRGGAIVIQDALNGLISKLPDDEKAELGLSPIIIKDPKGPRAFGPQSLDRISRLIDGGYAKELRNAIADQRAIYQPVNKDRLPGLQYRYDYHR